MAFLPERHRSPPPSVWKPVEVRYGGVSRPAPLQWQPVPPRRRSSILPTLLTAAIAAVFGFMVRSAIDHPRATYTAPVNGPVARTQPPPGPCADASGIVHGGPQPGGFATRDIMGWLPRCNEGGHR
jgi:hypothetical protein